MSNLSKLKKEIETVKNIEKITNSMFLVSSAKLQKIGKKIIDTKQFISEVYELFNNIIRQSNNSNFLKENDSGLKKTLWIVINSSLSLCGSYNHNVNKLVMNNIKSNDEIFAIGKKAITFYNNRKIKIRDQIEHIDINLSIRTIKNLGNEILSFYNEEVFDDIKIAYTKYINNVTFEPKILRLFPIIKNETNYDNRAKQITLEPDADSILDSTIMLYLNSILYGIIVESQVCEHASRRNAMENAKNNSNEMLEKLNIKYNKIRQNDITQEISEIVSGANAQKE